MPFALIVTRPDGFEYIHNPAPPGEPTMPSPSQAAAAVEVVRAFRNEGVLIAIREADRAALDLVDAELGTEFKHPSGYTFKITEF